MIMIYSGESLSVSKADNGVAYLIFDRKSGSVNKFDRLTVGELTAALKTLEGEQGITGLIISSAKGVFVVGADIGEFTDILDEPDDRIAEHLRPQSDNFLRLEQLDYPVVAAINGAALGGGLEICLACDVRVASELAAVGLPETGLGIIPGWGGTVRMPRLVGVQTSLEWITSGRAQSAHVAQEAGVVDFLVPADGLMAKAEAVMADCQNGGLDYKAVRVQKETVAGRIVAEANRIADDWTANIAAKFGEHYPAQGFAAQSVLQGLELPLIDALDFERQRFIDAVKTDQAKALIGNFLSDQYLMKCAKDRAKTITEPAALAGVLGAGIMGGGIAYQSALTGTPAVMKDIAQEGLDLGMGQASKLLSKRVKTGRMTEGKKEAILSLITPVLEYDEGFRKVDILIEAVIENVKVKHAVLTDVESRIDPSAIICSNTSTLPITDLAEPLARPEQFCGMHFFNPVHAMPLIEIIRGKKTSEETINRAVAYALSLRKKPVIVNDCPGFLINRLLFAYFAGFMQLVYDGADYEIIDQAMEKWGWPMGPAYLADVVGLDTMQHCDEVLGAAYLSRLKKDFKSWYQVIMDMGGLGQKNGNGFYNYSFVDGRPSKVVNDEVKAKVTELAKPSKVFSEAEIVERLMIPMAIEMAFALEEDIVASPEEADVSLLYGVGFPRFRGGVARWMDTVGLQAFCDMADKYTAELGPLYEVTARQRQMAANGGTYYDK
jgi:3-hydroxyacyl-CoA dehydrogenase/enoyl-CoA hydratase/3-hydroxybutyryl-CoA epimerase/enoyl-CoA isomerase